jgi:Mce-associated membrane protein
MPPKRRNNVPDSAAKGRRPRVAGTRNRVDDPASRVTPPPSPTTKLPKKPSTDPEQDQTAKSPVGQENVAAAAAVDTAATPDTKTADTKTAGTGEPISMAKSTPVKKAAPGAKTVSTAKASAAGKAKVPNLQPRISTQSAPKATPESGGSRITWKLVGILGAVAAVLGIFAVVAAFQPGGHITNTAWVDESGTAEVTKAGTEAIESLYTYNYETIDQDFDKARGYLNEAKRAEFDQTAATTKDAAIQTKTATEASVTDIGVTFLEGDRAELLAHMNVSATGDAVAQGSAATPLSVKLEKVDGKWVLSDISDSEG